MNNTSSHDYAASILESIDPITKGIAWGIASESLAQGERYDLEAAISAKICEWGKDGKSVSEEQIRSFRWAVEYYISSALARLELAWDVA